MERARIVAALLFLACAAGCGADAAPSSSNSACASGKCTVATAPCAAGFERDEAIGACLEIAPTDCAPGSGHFLGSRDCKPVGWTSCTAPFSADPSGWGCKVAMVAASRCEAGTAPVFGSAECKPVGDCDAPFPPQDATVFVDPNGPKDATHFQSLFDAALSAPKGSVVAVYPGRYVEDVDIPRSMTVVGKCARDVVIENPGDRRAGVLVLGGAKKVVVRGLTLTGHFSGIIVKGGSEATFEDVVIRENRWLGAYAAEAGSRLRVARSYIRDVVAVDGKFGWGAAAQLGAHIELADVVVDEATSAGVIVGGAGSTGKLERVGVRSLRLMGDNSAQGIGVVEGGDIEVDGVSIDGAARVGVMIEASSARARHLVVRNTTGGVDTRGIQVSKAGSLELRESLVMDTVGDAQLMFFGPGNKGTVTDVTLRGSVESDPESRAHGLAVVGGADVSIEKTAIVETGEVGLTAEGADTILRADAVFVANTRVRRSSGVGFGTGYGVGMIDGASVRLSNSAIVDNAVAGLVVTNSQAEGFTTRAEISSTFVRGAVGPGSRGVEVSRGASASMVGVAITRTPTFGLTVLDRAQVDLTDSLIRQTLSSAEISAGIVTLDDAFLKMNRVSVLDHPGVGITVASGGASLEGSLVARSGVAIHTDAATLLKIGDAASGTVGTRTFTISDDTRFVENQTRVGSGAVPLPSALGAFEPSKQASTRAP